MLGFRRSYRQRVVMPLVSRFFAVLAVLAALAPGLAEAASCASSAPGEKVRLVSVGVRLDIVLADGRVIYFPTIEPPRATAAEPDAPQDVVRQLTALLQDKSLILQRLGAADRWGRIPARLSIDGESEAVDETLIAAGLAMVSADPGACGLNVKAAETAARAARAGIWSDPAFAVLTAEDLTVFPPRAGTLAIVEGRARSFGHGFSRTYINLGDRRGSVTLVIAKRYRPAFDRAGFDEKSLANRRIRARGVVEMGGAPQIDLFHPAQIEFMEEAPRAGGSAQADSPARH